MKDLSPQAFQARIDAYKAKVAKEFKGAIWAELDSIDAAAAAKDETITEDSPAGQRQAQLIIWYYEINQIAKRGEAVSVAGEKVYRIKVVAVEDADSLAGEEEWLSLNATSITEARRLAPARMTINPRGRFLRFFDEQGNELAGNF